MASVFPNTTVRLFDEAGRNPAGVNAVAAPASTTKRRDEENMIEAEVPQKNRPKMQKVSTRTIKNHNGNARWGR
jgi:ribosomal protein L28